MDLEFQEKPVACLREQAVEVLYQEETLELIVPDRYPDIARIVDSCAVGCLQEQQLRTGSITVSGVFQATVLYTAEESAQVYTLNGFLPFSAHLDQEGITPEQTGLAQLRIRSVEARALNSRKISLRVSYAVRLSVYAPEEMKLWNAEPREGVQLRKTQERGLFPAAIGQRDVSLNERLDLPAMGSEIQRIEKAVPEIFLTDQSIAEDRVVLKGAVSLHTVYLLENGQLCSYDMQLPFAQYLEFSPEMLQQASLRVSAVLTDFELDGEEEKSVRVEFRLQVLVSRELELPLICDGYCVGNAFSAEYETYCLRQLLDTPSAAQTVEGKLQGTVRRLVDCTALVDFPVCQREEDAVTVRTSVQLHALYYDEEDQLCGEQVRQTASASFALHDGAICLADAEPAGSCYSSITAAESSICCGVNLKAACFAEKSVQGMCAATVGEALQGRKQRPSLVVRRTREPDCLWNIAKGVGTTVAAIREANELEDDMVDADRLILIPMV